MGNRPPLTGLMYGLRWREPVKNPVYKIDADVPLPEDTHKRGGQKETPLSTAMRSMQPGHSVFISDKYGMSLVASIAQRLFGAGNYKKRLRTEDGIPGVRVWRIK